MTDQDLFVDGGGRFAAVGALADLTAILAGEAGTMIRCNAPYLTGPVG